jgi:hypothetical protein
MKYCIEISESYLRRENVLDWVADYCRRNKIKVEEIIKEHGRFEGSFPCSYYRFIFKSEHQLNCFVRIGNNHFPYFEFL